MKKVSGSKKSATTKKAEAKKEAPVAAKPPPPPVPLSSYQAKVYLLHYQSRPPLNRLFSAVIREVCSYLADSPILAFPQEGFLHFFDASSESWSCIRCHRGDIFNMDSRYLHLGDKKVFACGGTRKGYLDRSKKTDNEATSHAAIISMENQVEVLENMKAERVGHGLTKYMNTVFVFGGYEGRTASTRGQVHSSEGFNLSQKAWGDLIPLKYARSDFCPCVWRHEIYLCGGGAPAVEVFNPILSTLREVEVVVPPAYRSVVFARGEELVMLYDSYAAVFRYCGEELRVVVEEKSFPGYFEGCAPLLWKGKVYIPLSSLCIALDIMTMDIVKEITVVKNIIG